MCVCSMCVYYHSTSFLKSRDFKYVICFVYMVFSSSFSSSFCFNILYFLSLSFCQCWCCRWKFFTIRFYFFLCCSGYISLAFLMLPLLLLPLFFSTFFLLYKLWFFLSSLFFSQGIVAWGFIYLIVFMMFYKARFLIDKIMSFVLFSIGYFFFSTHWNIPQIMST